MNDDEDTTAVLDALRRSLGPVAMHAPVEAIVAAGRRRRRGRRAAVAAGAAAVTGMAVVAATEGAADPAAGVHVHTAAYTVDSGADGSVRVTWDKQRYFEDHEGLQNALRQAGFPVLIKVGEFCRGPQDDAAVTSSGVGPGVGEVVHGERADGSSSGHDAGPDGKPSDEPGPPDSGAKPDGPGAGEEPGATAPADRGGPEGGGKAPDKADGPRTGGEASAAGQVSLVFTPSAMPPGRQLFIGYLTADQLAVTGGHPGSIERLVPTDVPLTCTTDLPTTAG
jgi:hypothetical protein